MRRHSNRFQSEARSRARFEHRVRRPTARVAARPDASKIAGWSLLAWLALALFAVATRAESQETFDFRSDTLTVANLIGAVELIEAKGSEFRVEARVRGADAERANIDFDVVDGSRARLLVEFPVERHQKYVYPQHRGRTTLSSGYNQDRGSLLGRIFSALRGGELEVTESGSGLEVWVDLTVFVPQDGTLVLENGVGDIVANDLVADLRIKSRAGGVNGSGLRGDHEFDLGSGRVTLQQITGDLVVDTGSGSVTVDGFEGRSISVDTGSGKVTVTDVRTRRFMVDTGSGSVHAEGISAEEATIDTGSGGVRLALTEMGRGDFLIDTGSGGITLLLPDYASATVVAETGSGGIDVGLDDVRVLRRERNQMAFEVGGGDTRVVLDTGSGGIRVASRDR